MILPAVLCVESDIRSRKRDFLLNSSRSAKRAPHDGGQHKHRYDFIELSAGSGDGGGFIILVPGAFTSPEEIKDPLNYVF